MHVAKRLRTGSLLPQLTRAYSSSQPGLISNTGGCHCGNIRYDYKTSNRSKHWSLQECQCSFCRKHNTCSVSDNGGEIDLFCQDHDLHRYQFGTKSCEHWMCAECGTYVGAITNNHKHATINVSTLDDNAEVLKQPKLIMDYEKENKEQREERRVHHWTPIHKIKIGSSTVVNGMYKMW